jgi:hypothetical protein
MRGLLTHLMLISLIAGNLEILTDSECSDGGEHSQTPFAGKILDHALTGSGDGLPIEDADCDHCCHGASHYTGLIAMPLRAVSMTPNAKPVAFTGAHPSLFFAPPLRPPNI